MQFLIPSQHKASAGVYAIRNRVDSRVYVGSTQDLWMRFTSHKSELKRNVHPSTGLQQLASQYGLDALRFELLEHAPVGTNLGNLEQKWIRKTKAAQPTHGFNSNAKANARIAQHKKQRLIVDITSEFFDRLSALANYKNVGIRDLARIILADALSIDNQLCEDVAKAKGNVSVSALLRLLVVDEARRLGIPVNRD